MPGIGPGSPDAGDEGDADRQRHRHVHAEPALPQIPPCRLEEGLARIADDRDGHDHAGPAQQAADAVIHALIVAEVHGHRHHHHLHRADAGDTDAAQRPVPLLLLQRLLTPRVEGMGVIADLADRPENVAEVNPAVVPGHLGAMGRVVDVEGEHAVERADVTLAEPDAGGTDDALENQRRFPDIAFANMDEGLLQRVVVVDLQLAQRIGHERLAHLRLGGAVTVVVLEPVVDDRLGHGLAAHAAHRPDLAFDFDRQFDVIGNGKTAVETGLLRGFRHGAAA